MELIGQTIEGLVIAYIGLKVLIYIINTIKLYGEE